MPPAQALFVARDSRIRLNNVVGGVTTEADLPLLVALVRRLSCSWQPPLFREPRQRCYSAKLPIILGDKSHRARPTEKEGTKPLP